MISRAPAVFPGGGNHQTAHSLLAHHGLISLRPQLFLFAFPRVCVCNNSLKPYRGEISGRRYGAGHYRSSTCITSFLPLVSPNGCRGAQQEGDCLNSISVHPCVCVCFFSLFFPPLLAAHVGRPHLCVLLLLFSSLQSLGLVSTNVSMCGRAHAR